MDDGASKGFVFGKLPLGAFPHPRIQRGGGGCAAIFHDRPCGPQECKSKGGHRVT